MADNESKELVVKDTNVALTDTPAMSMQDLLKDSQGLTIQFDKITTPAGGGISFEVTNPDTSEADAVKTLRGVILKSLPSNVFFENDYNGDNLPPDCSSNDGIIGIDQEGEQHDCATCARNQFGSATDGGKECKNRRTLYILLDGEVMPRLISLPSTSLTNLSKFQTQLLMSRRRIFDVNVKITLVKAQSKSGISYSKYVFTPDGVTTVEQSERIQNALALLSCANIG